jgi:hypothetical protein
MVKLKPSEGSIVLNVEELIEWQGHAPDSAADRRSLNISPFNGKCINCAKLYVLHTCLRNAVGVLPTRSLIIVTWETFLQKNRSGIYYYYNFGYSISSSQQFPLAKK